MILSAARRPVFPLCNPPLPTPRQHHVYSETSAPHGCKMAASYLELLIEKEEAVVFLGAGAPVLDIVVRRVELP